MNVRRLLDVEIIKGTAGPCLEASEPWGSNNTDTEKTLIEYIHPASTRDSKSASPGHTLQDGADTRTNRVPSQSPTANGNY